MPRRDEVIEQFLKLPMEEQADVARVLWGFPGPYAWISGIDRNPGVCGGEPCVTRTRIPVWLLEQLRRLGTHESEILRSYPTLKAVDLVNAWAYVEFHQSEIDAQIRENEEA
ncbi:MAG: DUF433 domain-containing protein [Planctomycetota bacterium]